MKYTDLSGVFFYASHVSAAALLRGRAIIKHMYWVYIMEAKDKSWYIGQTSDLRKRIREHKNGYGSKTTAKQSEWRCVYCEGYINHGDALGRERYLKSGAGRRFLKKQLAHFLTEDLD